MNKHTFQDIVMALHTDKASNDKGDAMTKGNRFQKGSGCYTCRICKKLTRSTGRGDNENVRLCERCYDMAGDENAIQDGTMTREQFKARWGVDPEVY